MPVTKFQLYNLYHRVQVRCAKEGVDLNSVVLSKSNRDIALNTVTSTKIISDEVNEVSGTSYGTMQDKLQQIRMLNDNMRYHLDGKLRIIALMINEWLPKRMDYRNTPRPTMNPVNTGKVVGVNECLLPYLSVESIDYISYLVRMSTNSDDYSAKLPINDYKVVFQNLESICTMWQLDPTEHKSEMLYCRLLAEVNEQGVPIQLNNSNDEKTVVLREIIPVVHAIARYRRASQSPFYKFVNMMPTVLIELLGCDSDAYDLKTLDLAMDMLNDILVFNMELKENSDKASQFLSRFHHGHPLYIDMIQVLRVQHTLMLTFGSDLMRRFGALLLALGESDATVPESLDVFLQETRLAQVYRQQQQLVETPVES